MAPFDLRIGNVQKIPQAYAPNKKSLRRKKKQLYYRGKKKNVHVFILLSTYCNFFLFWITVYGPCSFLVLYTNKQTTNVLTVRAYAEELYPPHACAPHVWLVGSVHICQLCCCLPLQRQPKKPLLETIVTICLPEFRHCQNVFLY